MKCIILILVTILSSFATTKVVGYSYGTSPTATDIDYSVYTHIVGSFVNSDILYCLYLKGLEKAISLFMQRGQAFFKSSTLKVPSTQYIFDPLLDFGPLIDSLNTLGLLPSYSEIVQVQLFRRTLKIAQRQTFAQRQPPTS